MDIQVTVDPNDYGIERGVYASWLGNALPDVIAQGLIDDGFAALTTEPTNNNSGSGNALPTSAAYATAIPLDDNKYSAQTTISGATAFTLASGAVTGGQYTVRLVADGTNTPTFSSAFEEVTGSSGYDNTANVVNVLSVYYDGVDALYSWTQRIGDTGASDVTAPTFSSYVVADGAADTVVITASEALDQTSTLATGDFAVSGHTVSAVSYGSSTTIELTVTPDFVNGEATRTFTYTNNADRVVDLAGNPAATTGAQNITNNVGSTDADAQAFISAAGISDNTQQTAINNLVASFKSSGVWNKLIAFWPFVGGTAASHKFNLKNPVDTNAGFRLVFGGGLTHDANGVEGNGTSGFAATNFEAYVDGGSDEDISLGVYINKTITFGSSNVWIGVSSFTFTETMFFGVANGGSEIAGVVGQDSATGDYAGRVTSPTSGQFTLNATTGRVNTLYDGTGSQLGNTFVATGATNSGQVNLFRFEIPSTKLYSDTRMASAHIGLSMTPAEINAYTSAVNAFQTALGRNG